MAACSPCCPSGTAWTCIPAACVCWHRISRLVGLSSTISNRTPRRSGTAAVIGRSAAGRSARLKRKVDPWPGTLATVSCPPIISISWREMARPSPAPPYLRVVELSA